jgi:hypothetical protein
MTVYFGDKESIFNSKVQLEQQIPSIGSILPANVTFAEASPKDLFGNGLSKATRLSANELRSGVFINDDNGFHFEPFPNIMQISPIRDFWVADIIADTALEIFSVGNLLSSSMQEGRYAAGRGSLIAGLPQTLKILPNRETGLSVKGDARRIKSLKFQGKDLIAVAINNDSIVWFKPNGQ